MEEPRDIVYAEVFELLKNIDKTKVMRIPREILEEIDRGRNKEIKIEYDWDDLVNKEKFYPDTLNIIGYLNYTYWADTEEEKENLKKIYNIPEEVEVKEMFELKPPREEGLVALDSQEIEQNRVSFFERIKRLFSK